jgi:hypothetical protein
MSDVKGVSVHRGFIPIAVSSLVTLLALPAVAEVRHDGNEMAKARQIVRIYERARGLNTLRAAYDKECTRVIYVDSGTRGRGLRSTVDLADPECRKRRIEIAEIVDDQARIEFVGSFRLTRRQLEVGKEWAANFAAKEPAYFDQGRQILKSLHYYAEQAKITAKIRSETANVLLSYATQSVIRQNPAASSKGAAGSATPSESGDSMREFQAYEDAIDAVFDFFGRYEGSESTQRDREAAALRKRLFGSFGSVQKLIDQEVDEVGRKINIILRNNSPDVEPIPPHGAREP